VVIPNRNSSSPNQHWRSDLKQGIFARSEKIQELDDLELISSAPDFTAGKAAIQGRNYSN
jgi:hypothetical protein